MSNYAKAYVEVLELLKYLPKNELYKIPSDRIAFFEKNKDPNYHFILDNNKRIEQQRVMRETNAIMVNIFEDYFANATQKEKLDKILKRNEEMHLERIKARLNSDNIFENVKKDSDPPTTEKLNSTVSKEMTMMSKPKENIFTRIINFFKNLKIK